MIVDIKLKVWTAKQTGEFIQPHAEAVIRKAESGIIPGRKTGNRWRFMPETIRAFMLNKVGGSRKP
jgi:hypothetical protein